MRYVVCFILDSMLLCILLQRTQLYNVIKSAILLTHTWPGHVMFRGTKGSLATLSRLFASSTLALAVTHFTFKTHNSIDYQMLITLNYQCRYINLSGIGFRTVSQPVSKGFRWLARSATCCQTWSRPARTSHSSSANI